MKKRTVTILLCLALVLFSVFRAYAEADSAVTVPAEVTPQAQTITPAGTSEFDVPCEAAILVDEDSGTVLYEKNADEQRPIASITKVMTLLLTFQALESRKISLEDNVPVSEHAYSMGGSQIWLEPGEQMTLNDMLKAICVSSANDAAVAVAEFVGGSEPAFVQMMNETAAQLGMTSTHFENACGLDQEGHLSSARDVAIMSREMLLHHTEVRDYCSIWTDTLRNGATQLVNTNKLLKSYNGITGLKTGTTSKAGVCISASAERNGLRLIAVVLGSASGKERFQAATALLDYGFANFENITAELPDDAPQTIPVTRGTADAVALEYDTPQKCLVPKGQGENLRIEVELPQTLQAPVKAGSQVGTVHWMDGEAELQTFTITAAQDVEALSFGYCFGLLVQSLALSDV
ncbi:D-alanyl-D-alanine carboxypeptidase family protein [Subdoligranulum variabile]|uniref:serine-type D-Ala-D-Ala carboxypeptidase n=1 Tax=Subdoligranulum variabile DSM 15176 TaxID=411471 RepID=D1PM51_9FIRM|nr:D-alanyl-D-alanine carboxypeptidase family protein [Subdoligranulum variabile]EFB75636.1 serine-type D-Ala-D-Ala carboxypeptidase [Subdoligranulum variabile DSM 15176]UWP68345.1 D-alanyl-D-alanine carboxypeptidase [Subdoligranulum variabile]